MLWALVFLVAMLGSTLLAALSDRVQRLRLIRAVTRSIGGVYERLLSASASDRDGSGTAMSLTG